MRSSPNSSAIAWPCIRGSTKSISGSSDARGAALLREIAGGDIACAIVLGSGLAGAFRGHPDLTSVTYSAIGGLPEPRAKGHVGEALVGMLGNRRIVAFCGRFHLYEGRTTSEVVSLVELGIAAGAKTLIVTNAAGGLQRTYTPGDVMVIRDQLNLTGQNPLAVAQLPDGITERFVNMSDTYDAGLRDIAQLKGPKHGLRIQQGVYAGLLGPSFETPAEVSMLRTLGADAVGMSTVLETIMARARGVSVFGASLITNVHDGQPTNSDEVNEEGDRAAPAFAGLLTDIIAELPV